MDTVEKAGSTSSERLLLAVLAAFTALSVIGFATVGMRPELLARMPPSSAAFYPVAFRFFAVGQVWVAMGVIAVFLTRRVGVKWLPAFGLLYMISLGSELMGTTRGIPFGSYSYSSLLDPMWLGHVPWIIPLSWFYMAVPSWGVALVALPGRGTAARIALASLLLLTWDLALDPAMSHATKYWVWEGSGPYYGMPWLNLFGWYVTGIALMGGLALLRADRWISQLPSGWLSGFYAVNLFLAVGMCAAAGLWLAVACTLGTLAATYALTAVATSRTSRLPSSRQSVAVRQEAR